jgi:hypothetical protein
MMVKGKMSDPMLLSSRKVLLCTFLLAIRLWPISTFASNVTMEYRIGFNDRFQLGQWVPLTLFVENRGHPLAGTLRVMVRSGSEYRDDVYTVTHSMDIELPFNSKKRYSFTIRLNSFSHPLRIQIVQADQIILAKSINLRPYYVQKGFGVVVSEKTSAADGSFLPDGLYSIVTQAPFLPEAWYGYDSVDLLIVHTAVLDDLNDRQVQALVGWVKRGGYLVLSGGPRTHILLGERFKGLLPITVSGFEWIDELKSMPDFCGHPFKAPNPFPITKALIKDSTVLLHQDETPVIIQKRVDLGNIAFIAFDYTAPWFHSWEGRKPFWENVYTHRPMAENGTIDLDMQAVSRSLLSGLPSRFPNKVLSIMIMLAYLIFMSLFLSRLKKRKRPHWRAFRVCIMCIIVFSTIGFWFYIKNGPQKSVAHNSLVFLDRGAGSGPMIPTKHVVGIYTLENTDQTISLDPGNRPFVPLSFLDNKDKIFPVRDIHITEKNNQHVLSMSFKKWSCYFLTTDSVTHFPLQATLLDDDDAIRLSWSNPTAHGITNGYAYLDGRMVHMGDMGASQKGIIDIPLPQMIPVERFLEQMEASVSPRVSAPLSDRAKRPLRNDILKNAVNRIHGSHPSQSRTLHVLGWMDPPLVPYSFQASDLSNDALTLLQWEMPLEGETDGP